MDIYFKMPSSIRGLLFISSILVLLAVSAADVDFRNMVLVPPAITHQSNVSVIYIKSSSIVPLPCAATGTPKPEIAWYRDSNRITDFDIYMVDVSTGTLTLDTLNMPLSKAPGVYHCTATSRVDGIEIGVAVSRSVIIEIAKMESFLDTSVPVTTVSEGQPYSIKCNAPNSVPKLTYRWVTMPDFKGDSAYPVTFDNRRSINDKGDLVVGAADMSDNANDQVYACSVENSILQTIKRGNPTKVKVNAVANPPPREVKLISNSGPTVTALQGETVRLFCLFSAYPSITSVTWSKLGGPLPQHSNDFGQTHLLMKNVKNIPEYDGTYRCIGKNSRNQQASADIVLKVLEKPSFKIAPLNTNVTEGGTASFLCSGAGEPMPQIVWMKNNREIETPLPPRVFIKDGNLTLTQLHKGGQLVKSDLAVYQCKLKSNIGTNIESAYINIVAPLQVFAPTPGETTDIYALFNEQVILQANWTSDPSKPPSFSWLFNDAAIKLQAGKIWVKPDGALVIETNKFDSQSDVRGKYTVYVRTKNPDQMQTGSYRLDFRGVAAFKAAGTGGLWWIAIIIACLIVLIIIILFICMIRRNKGDTYNVDENERKNGNDPEKECADSGFHDFMRHAGNPVGGSRASLSDMDKPIDSDEDNDSMAEYGDIDTGKFNEDGSFIGQYGKNKHPKNHTPSKNNSSYA